MTTKATLVEIKHDEGYGDDLLYFLNVKLRGCDMIGVRIVKPRRIDSAGRDVTDLPGLWDESDRFESELLEFVREVSLDPWPDSDLRSLLKTLQTRAQYLLKKAGEQ